MQFLLRFFLTFILVMSSAFADKVEEFQSKILYKRVREVLDYRVNELRSCRSVDQHFINDYQNALKTKYSSQGERLETFLNLLGETQRFSGCAAAIQTGDKKLNDLQRRKLKLPMAAAKAVCLTNRKCLDRVNLIIKELDPFCATQNSPNLFGNQDPNPCMAGDRLLGKTIRRSNDPGQNFMGKFLFTLEGKLKAAKVGAKIDLWSHYLTLAKDTPVGRKKFLALMTFFYYSLGTAGGYIDGIGDWMWWSPFNEFETPASVFREFYSSRQKADWYRNLTKIRDSKNITLLMNGRNVQAMNRHDFMATFLACHYKEQGELISKLLPNFLGFGYESLDFVSHIKGKVKLSVSIDNFTRDTSRYVEGTRWGRAFCANL